MSPALFCAFVEFMGLWGVQMIPVGDCVGGTNDTPSRTASPLEWLRRLKKANPAAGSRGIQQPIPPASDANPGFQSLKCRAKDPKRKIPSERS